jgi:hypothetical protein
MSFGISVVATWRQDRWRFVRLALKRTILTALVAVGVRTIWQPAPVLASITQEGKTTTVGGYLACDCTQDSTACRCVINNGNG